MNLSKHWIVLGLYLLLTPLWAHGESTNAETNSALRSCRPIIRAAPAVFPYSSQIKGEHGTVNIAVSIGRDGKVIDAHTVRSSGYTTLDAAAEQSVARQWTFDVDGCANEPFPLQRTVEVEYERAPLRTFSALQVAPPSVAPTLHGAEQCFVSPVRGAKSQDAAVACIKPSSSVLVGAGFARVVR